MLIFASKYHNELIKIKLDKNEEISFYWNRIVCGTYGIVL